MDRYSVQFTVALYSVSVHCYSHTNAELQKYFRVLLCIMNENLVNYKFKNQSVYLGVFNCKLDWVADPASVTFITALVLLHTP